MRSSCLPQEEPLRHTVLSTAPPLEARAKPPGPEAGPESCLRERVPKSGPFWHVRCSRLGSYDRNDSMPFEIPSEPVPIPARLVERGLDLARAEVGLALVHTRRIAVRAVSALLATIVACAFAQLSIVLLVAWPVLAERVPTPNL